jgi:Ca2+-binding EF-hand superfamily protein
MQRAILTLTVVAATAFATTGLDAQSNGNGRGNRQAQMRFNGMDQNHDGMIQRDEWQGSNRAFSNQDWNGDGVLSGQEVRVGAQRDTSWEEADHDATRAERNLSWTASAFTNLDHNRDGRLTTNEWHYDLETFRRVDSNRNNSLSRGEFLGVNQDDGRDINFDDLDTNNNGRVERAEWYFSAPSFQSMDRNRDGTLSRFEVVGGQNTNGDVYNQFASLDYDRNGTLARNEWHWSAASFTQRDTDRNGVLSQREFETMGGAPGNATSNAPSPATQTVKVNAQQRWTDAVLEVRAGDVITFESSGSILMSDNSADTASPGGSNSGRRAPDAPILNQPAGGIVARIGNYGPIWIGDRRTLTAPVSGRLYLGVNDDHLPDNRGEFTVIVGVQGRTTF